MLRLALLVADRLRRLDGLFVCAPASSSFITTDRPFVLVAPLDDCRCRYDGIGLLTAGARKLIPLSQRTCLVVGDRGWVTDYAPVPVDMVRAINLAVAFHSDKLVIGRDERLLRRLAKTLQFGPGVGGGSARDVSYRVI